MTSRRAAAKAHAADMIDVEARLAPFFLPPHGVLVDQPPVPAREPVAPTMRRRLTPLRHEPV